MAEEPEASALTAKRAAQHVRLSRANDAYEHLHILTATTKPRPANARKQIGRAQSELQSHSDLHSFPTRRSSDLKRAAQHVRLSRANDAYEHLHILTATTKPRPANARK